MMMMTTTTEAVEEVGRTMRDDFLFLFPQLALERTPNDRIDSFFFFFAALSFVAAPVWRPALSSGNMRLHCLASRGGAARRGAASASERGGKIGVAARSTSSLKVTSSSSTSTSIPPPLLRQRLAAAAAAAALSHPLLAHPVPAALAQASTISPSDVVVDTARLIPDGKEPALAARIRALEADKEAGGFRVRLATRFRDDPAAPTDEDLRKAWRPDPRTVVVLADPSSPNMLRILPGEGTGAKLSRGFYLELAARFGNLFVRREDGGDGAALEKAMDTLLACLESDAGCQVVPGLPDDQRNLTTVFAAAAGFVAGFASRVRPFSTSANKPWTGLLLFAPLWGTLLVNFGLAPILVRTDDRLPLLANLAVFAAGVALFRASPLFAGEPGRDRDVLTREGQRRLRERESESENSDAE